MTETELVNISVGREELVKYTVEKIISTAKSHLSTNIIFIGQRGIGKTHLLLRIFYKLRESSKITPVRLSEEEYSITSIRHLFEKILEIMKENYSEENVVEDARQIFKEKKSKGKPIVVFVENLQLLFDQINEDLPKLRSIMQEDNSFSIIGSAVTEFDQITSPDAPFYNYFEVHYLKGLSEEEISELIRKRLQIANKENLIKSMGDYEDRIKGLHILTGGSPRLIHTLCEILVRKSSFADLEKNLLELLDQLTPFYQTRMETISKEKRKILDTLALSDGPLTPTELAINTNMKNTIVVSQLHRLQNDGLVEPVKFTDKKNVRYQVSDRLYRIWREMRTIRGSTRVNLFVDFLKIWYSRDELVKEYENVSEKVGQLLFSKQTEVHAYIKDMCYLLDSLPDVALIALPSTVEAIVKTGNYDLARNEIDKVKRTYSKSENVVLQKAIVSLILYAELKILSGDQYNETHNEFDKNISYLIDNRVKGGDKTERFLIHEIYEHLAEIMIENKDYEKASKFNQISFENADNWCSRVINQKGSIALYLNKPEISVETGNEVLSKIPDDEYALSNMVIAYDMLDKKDEVISVAVRLSNVNVENLAVSINSLLQSGAYDQGLKLLQNNIKKIEKLDNIARNGLVLRLSSVLFHNMIHAIDLERKDDLEFCVKTFSYIEKYMDSDILLESFLYSTRIHAKHENEMYGIISELYKQVGKMLNSDKMEVLRPIQLALEFIETQNVEIFEKLHKEYRELIINIISDISPETNIPKEIIESL